MFFFLIVVFTNLFGFPKVNLLRLNYFRVINCPWSTNPTGFSNIPRFINSVTRMRERISLKPNGLWQVLHRFSPVKWETQSNIKRVEKFWHAICDKWWPKVFHFLWTLKSKGKSLLVSYFYLSSCWSSFFYLEHIVTLLSQRFLFIWFVIQCVKERLLPCLYLVDEKADSSGSLWKFSVSNIFF